LAIEVRINPDAAINPNWGTFEKLEVLQRNKYAPGDNLQAVFSPICLFKSTKIIYTEV
jgi:hypothetical protein